MGTTAQPLRPKHHAAPSRHVSLGRHCSFPHPRQSPSPAPGSSPSPSLPHQPYFPKHIISRLLLRPPETTRPRPRPYTPRSCLWAEWGGHHLSIIITQPPHSNHHAGPCLRVSQAALRLHPCQCPHQSLPPFQTHLAELFVNRSPPLPPRGAMPPCSHPCTRHSGPAALPSNHKLRSTIASNAIPRTLQDVINRHLLGRLSHVKLN